MSRPGPLRPAHRRLAAAAAAVVGATLALTACSSSSPSAPPTTSTSRTPPLSTSPLAHDTLPELRMPTTPRTSPTTTHSSSSSTAHMSPAPRTSSSPPRTSTSVAPPAHGAPVIVIDPGHSPTVSGTDQATGLDTADYANEPEMHDVYAVALLVRSALEAKGYKVYLTKSSADDRANLGDRAYLANNVHADLALSIHDQAGANGGLAFDSANNNVYYQAVGDYRVNPAGHKVTFTNSAIAAVSKRYGEIFQQQRQSVEGHSVRLLSNTGYDLGSRGLQAGDMWIVQLLSHVPWIYNESGGNSAGQVGLDSADKQTYANGLVAGIEHCVAPPR